MRIVYALLFFGLVGTASAQLLPPEQQPIPVDGFAAVVNERIITVGEVLTLIDRDRKEVIQTIRNPQDRRIKLQELYEQGLQMLIDRALILEGFAETEIQMPENLVDDRVHEIVNKQFANDRTAFEQALIDEGTSLKEWRDQIRDNLRVQILRRQEIYDRLAIHPRQVRELYEQRIKNASLEERVHLRSITMKRPVDEAERKGVLEKLYGLRIEITNGGDFAELAKQHSQGPKAAVGGDFGWTKLASLKKELRAGIKNLKAGEISEPIPVDDLYYLLRVEEVEDGSVRSLADMQDELEAELMAVEEKRLYTAWIDRLRNKHHVKKFQ